MSSAGGGNRKVRSEARAKQDGGGPMSEAHPQSSNPLIL